MVKDEYNETGRNDFISAYLVVDFIASIIIYLI